MEFMFVEHIFDLMRPQNKKRQGLYQESGQANPLMHTSQYSCFDFCCANNLKLGLNIAKEARPADERTCRKHPSRVEQQFAILEKPNAVAMLWTAIDGIQKMFWAFFKLWTS